jgi:hypothetical protein
MQKREHTTAFALSERKNSGKQAFLRFAQCEAIEIFAKATIYAIRRAFAICMYFLLLTWFSNLIPYSLRGVVCYFYNRGETTLLYPDYSA